ncbi:hypothetical protein DT070_05915 [Polaromonas sp. SP1]|nr:hypothetical protein DT070_05915 [Polaromonas sp. SP1]
MEFSRAYTGLVRPLARGWLVAVFMVIAASPVNAQTLKQCAKEAAGCVVNVAKSAYYSVSAVGSALEFAALHPNCVADVTSGNPVTIGISSAIVGVAATGVINASSYSACKANLYGVAAKPIASAISEIIPDPTIKKFATEAGADYAGDGFEAIASGIPVPLSVGAPTVAAQLVCGCAVAAAGSGVVENLKNALIASAAAANSCSATMGCLGGAALNAIADAGKAVGQVSVAVAKCGWTPNDCGEKEAIPPAEYWRFNFQPFVPVYADLLVTNANTYCGTNSIYEYKSCTPAQELENKRNECLSYHTAHQASADTARAVCNPMRDRVINEAQAIVNRRMTDEVFPQKAIVWAKKTFPLEGANRFQTGDFSFCNAPKDPGQGQSVDLTGASTYVGSSAAAQITTECVNTLLRSIGLDRNNNLVLNGDPGRVTLLADARARAQKGNAWDFDKSFQGAYDTWTARRNVIKSNYAAKVVKAAKDDDVYLALNPLYAKAAVDTYVAGVGACPKFGEAGQATCVASMREYMGIRNDGDYQNPAKGSVDFSVWGGNPPKPYQSAMSLLEKVKADKGNVNEAMSGALAWAMQDARSFLQTLPAKALATEKAKQKQTRDNQNISVARAQDQLDDAYADAKSRCKQDDCKPKVDEIRKTEKIAEGNLLKTLVIGSVPDVPFRGLDAYLAGMKSLAEATRPKYKAVLDADRFVAVGAGKGVGAAAISSALAGGGSAAAVKPASPPSGTGALTAPEGLPKINPGVANAGVGEAGQARVGIAPGVNMGAIPPVGVQGAQGMQGALQRPPLPSPAQPGRIGMPGLPTMGALPAATPSRIATQPGIAAVTPPPPATGPAVVAMPPAGNAGADVVLNKQAPAPVAIPGAVPGLVPGAPPSQPVAVVMPPAGNAGANVVLNNQPPPGAVPGVAAALVPPFDARAFRVEREKAIRDEWMPQCKGNAACSQGMTVLMNRRIDGEVQALTAGSPDYKNKAAVAAFIDKLDTQFDPQFAALIPKPAVVAVPVPPVPAGTPAPKPPPKIQKIPGL